MRSFRLFSAASMLLLLTFAASVAHSQDQPRGEAEVKAAFLFNFLKFVELQPIHERSLTSFDVCVTDAGTLGIFIGALSGKHVADKPLRLLLLTPETPPLRCHAMFVDADYAQAETLLGRLRGHSVLTVGESPSFLHQGGIINFYIEESRVRFEVNNDKADSVGIRISSKLLSLARIFKP